MLAATFFDPVLGLDTHIVLVPTPAGPVPTPMPMPFVGMVFDPAGLAMGAAMGAALSGSPGLVMVNSMPAGNCGTAVTNTMTSPHIPAPGPFAVGMPGNDAETMFGGLNAGVGGSFGLRLGDIALSCSDPVRMPTSVVLAIPKGMPFLLLRPPVPDIATILMGLAMKAAFRLVAGALRFLVRQGRRLFRMLRTVQRRAGSTWERAAQRAHGAVDRVFGNPSRMRNRVHDAVCFVTGHPVDVATGRMFTEVEDFSLPGPIPLRFVRRYDSNRSNRKGVLGHGWSHSLEQSIWLERGRVVLWDADGREIEIQTLDLPGRELGIGMRVEHLREGLLVKRTAERDFEVETRDGLIRVFRDVGGHPKGRWVSKLAAIRHRSGNAVDLAYDGRGLLTHVRDSCGRIFELAYDADGMLALVKLPVRVGQGLYMHRRYEYDARSDLVQVTDSMGRAYRYEYVSHLMVKETDRTGHSYYFVYDGRSSGAKCVRTWGDGGIYDHVVHYDAKSRKTIVENSTAHVTVYERDRFDQVVKILDAHGGENTFEYDETHGFEVKSTNAVGQVVVRVYDARARLVELKQPDGATVRVAYDARDLPVEAIDAIGGRWTWAYDMAWQMCEASKPDGSRVRYAYSGGLLVGVESSEGRRVTLEYDAQRMLRAVRGPAGDAVEHTHDSLGGRVKSRNAEGMVRRIVLDSEGRTREAASLAGVTALFAYDAEGRLVEARDATRHVRFRYGGHGRVIEREEGGARLAFTYDGEGRLLGIDNELGERATFTVDGLGHVSEEIGFDGASRRYLRDAAGRVVKILSPSQKATELVYDAAGRVAKVAYEGGGAEYRYRPDGSVLEAKNESSTVIYERDPLGRVLSENVDGIVVESRYTADGEKGIVRTSLGAHWSFGHDARGLLETIRIEGMRGTANAWEQRIERDPVGRERMRSLPGGLRLEWSRDGAGRPTRRRTVRDLPSGSTSELDVVSFQWRGEDQLAWLVDPARGPRFFDHDARGRLVRERRPDRVIERTLDASGSVLRTSTGGTSGRGPGGRPAAGDGLELAYDADGQLVHRAERGGRSWRYGWNGSGMLVEAERDDGLVLRFGYDAFARRTSKRVSRRGASGEEAVEREVRYAWDGDSLVHELDSGAGMTTWYWEPGASRPVACERGERRWSVASDHLGTPTEMYDELGALAWKMQLDVFGVATFENGGPEDCPFRHPGQYEDVETGLYYNRFRYYDKSTGSYVSPDPVGVLGGVAAYGFVEDPTLETDPFGLDTHIGDAGERAASRWLESQVDATGNQRYQVVGPLQNPSGHGVDLVYQDLSTGRVHVAEIKANSATLSVDQARGADAFTRSRLSRSRSWPLTPEGRAAQQALDNWMAANPTRRVTGLVIYTDVTVDSLGRARGTVVSTERWTRRC